jgi:hypothetical protein
MGESNMYLTQGLRVWAGFAWLKKRAGSETICEQSKEPSSSIKGEEFLV